MYNPDLFKYFPEKYFSSSHVPLINLRLENYAGKDMQSP